MLLILREFRVFKERLRQAQPDIRIYKFSSFSFEFYRDDLWSFLKKLWQRDFKKLSQTILLHQF